MSDAFFEGLKVGRYEVITRLSVGGMAELSLARLLGPGGFEKLVALKMILPDVRDDERFVQMFLDEAQLAAELSHPNLGQVFELGQEPSGELYLAMEFLAGQNLGATLRALAKRKQTLPVEQGAAIVRDVCLGLHAAHTHRDKLGEPKPVIHRDVNPTNVMLTFDGQVKLIDFGLALSSGRRVRTKTGVVKGTPTYIAPEQLLGERATRQSDIFSAGVLLHECLTGQRLFTVDLPPRRFAEVIKPPSALNPLVPRALDEVCLRALAIEPSKRFETASEFAKSITRAMHRLAQPDELAVLTNGLFSAQRTALARLVEAAQSEDEPATLSQLAKRAFIAPEVVTEQDVTKAAVEAKETPLAEPNRRGLIFAIGAVLVAIAAGVIVFTVNEPAPVDTTAQPLALIVAARPPPPPPRPVAPPPQDRLDRAESIAKTDPREALRLFDDVLLDQPTHWRALMGSATALQALGDDEAARGRLQRAAAQPVGALDKKDHARTYYALALAEHAARRDDAARAAMKEASALDLAETRSLATGGPLESFVDARAVPKQPPTVKEDALDPRVRIYIEQARALRSQNLFDPAIKVLEQCLHTFRAEPDCTVMLGSVYASRGSAHGNDRDNDEAMRLYKEFLKVAPANHRLRSRVDQIVNWK